MTLNEFMNRTAISQSITIVIHVSPLQTVSIITTSDKYFKSNLDTAKVLRETYTDWQVHGIRADKFEVLEIDLYRE